jgi:hypothetical protein
MESSSPSEKRSFEVINTDQLYLIIEAASNAFAPPVSLACRIKIGV